MATTPMTSVEAVRARAAAAVRSRMRDWLVDPETGRNATLRIALHPPPEHVVARDPDAARAWARAWHRYDGPGDVEMQTVRWPSFGTQEVPVRIVVSGADDICRAAAESQRWRLLSNRRGSLIAVLGSSEAVVERVAGLHKQWSALDDADFARLTATIRWLLDHPDSGLLIRQLPIEGVDTKWLGRHRPLVEHFIEAARGSRRLGIRTAPRLTEIALLDRSMLVGWPRIVALTVDGMASLDVEPTHVVIVENRETLHALPASPGTIAVHGGGNAVGSLARVGWITSAPHVVYWGDLDHAGVLILGRLRRILPQVRSVMTDPATLDRWRHLTVGAARIVDNTDLPLTEEELQTLDTLIDDGLLLEQERIPWSWALDRLAEAGVSFDTRPRPIP